MNPMTHKVFTRRIYSTIADDVARSQPYETDICSTVQSSPLALEYKVLDYRILIEEDDIDMPGSGWCTAYVTKQIDGEYCQIETNFDAQKLFDLIHQYRMDDLEDSISTRQTYDILNKQF
jgi:hypothetical protein